MDSNRDEQSGAIAEGRRIYLGNLLYATKPNEIEQALEEHGFGNYVQIHVSVDPVSGRNPGYCFVDFQDRETAEAALTDLNATVRGRTLKVGPCQPKQQGQRRENNGGSRWGPSQRDAAGDSQNNNSRWGDWKRGTDGRNGSNNTGGSRGALDHYNDHQEPSGKRVYIGGLGKMVDQDQNQAEISELLAGHNPLAIGKRITARDRETQVAKPNANYCFVDFATTDEAQSVVDALNGMDYGDAGGYLRVSIARGAPERRDNRDGNNNGNYNSNNQDGGYNNGGRQQNNYRNRQKPDDAGVQRAFDSNNWRRKE
ncbi:hypothetical protein SCUCBS95973_004449 [Sporothrix curviconia]|uniref:RRM domain-containing protein n=1 Tax=Sporothrix curviconia TaxID=1260050 RepID=A0ABP0BP62_9PEZI